MALLNDIYFGESGSEQLLPAFERTFAEGYERIERSERMASARLVSDIIADKKKFTITFAEISHTDLEVIATLYELQTDLSLKVTRPDYSVDTYTVKLQPFDQERVASVEMNYWGNVQLELLEV